LLVVSRAFFIVLDKKKPLLFQGLFLFLMPTGAGASSGAKLVAG
jgi:hypothetical protein